MTVGRLREKLTSSELAALSVSSYCASDVSSLSKLAWLSNFRTAENEVVTWLKYSQESAILKALTVRLFEFWRFAKSCENQNGDVGEVAKQVISQFYWIEESVGFEVGQIIRDRASAHTSMKDTKAALKNVPDSISIEILNNDNCHNSFYSLGDEVFIFGQLRGLVDENHNVRDLIECWYQWAKSSSDALTIFHVRLMKVLLHDRFEDFNVKICSVPFPKHLVIDASDGTQLPIFAENMPQ